MRIFLVTCVLAMCVCLPANADVWRWTDTDGKTHFVDTMTPIFTWTDDFGKRHYSDTPGHEDAVSVELVWHASGSLSSLENDDSVDDDDFAYPGESVEDREKRKKAEAYYCERATEIYDSYVNAPQLYRTDENGEREYLSKKDAATTIAETRTKRDELCE